MCAKLNTGVIVLNFYSLSFFVFVFFFMFVTARHQLYSVVMFVCIIFAKDSEQISENHAFPSPFFCFVFWMIFVTLVTMETTLIPARCARAAMFYFCSDWQYILFERLTQKKSEFAVTIRTSHWCCTTELKRWFSLAELHWMNSSIYGRRGSFGTIPEL